MRNNSLNEIWEARIKNEGVDFLYFVDVAVLPMAGVAGYSCVVFFGRAISRAYINALKKGEAPKTKEVINTERKMDKLSVKIANELTDEGYNSTAKIKFGLLPHKTVALNAGLGFIGKNNLLVMTQYGCAVMFGKVLTTAPFAAMHAAPIEPQCGNCTVCIDACPSKALLGTTWNVNVKRDDMMIRKNCILCHSCMIYCPYTEKYSKN